MTTRDVIFQLTAVPDPKLKSGLASFITQARAAQEEIRKAEQDSAVSSIALMQRRAAAERTTSSEIESLRVQAASFDTARQQKSKDTFAKLEAEKVRIAQAAAKAIAETETMLSKAGAPLNPAEKAKLKVDIEKRAAVDIEKIEKQITTMRIREADKASHAQEASVKRALKEAETAAAQESKAREAATKTAEQMAGKQKAAMREVMQNAAELGEGVMKIGRGFVALGLVGERDLAKVQDTLLRMQATFDLVSGSIQTFLKITKMIDSMRAATVAATLAQEALNAAQARGAVTGAGGAARGVGRGVGGVVASGAAGAAGAGLVSSGGAGVAGAASAAAPFAAAGAGIAGGLFGIAGIGGSAQSAMQYGIGGGAAPGSYTDTVGGSSWNPFGRMIASNQNAAKEASDKRVTEAEKQAARAKENAERRDARLAELSPIVAEKLAKDRSNIDESFGAAMDQVGARQGSRSTDLEADEARRNKASRDAFAKLQDERVALASQSAKKTAAEEANAAETASKRLLEIDREMAAQRQAAQKQRDAAANSSIDDRRQMAAAQIAKSVADEEKRIVEYKAQAAQFDEGSAVRESFTKAAEESEKRIVGLLQQRRDVERQAGQEKRAAAEASLRFSEQELETARARADAARDSLLSAKERFGLMDAGEQSEIVGLAKRAKAGEALNPEELKRLQGVGLESTSEIVRRQALARADAGGFGQIAGEDQRRAEALKKQADALQVQVEDKRQIVINLQQDADKMAKKMADELAARIGKADQELLAKFEAAIGEIRVLRQAMLNGAGRG